MDNAVGSLMGPSLRDIQYIELQGMEIVCLIWKDQMVGTQVLLG